MTKYHHILRFREHRLVMFLHKPGEYVSDWIRRTDTFFEVGWLDLLYQNQDFLSPQTSVALDIGANIGNHTIFLEKILNFQAVYAFEPIAKNFSLLTQNTSRSQCIQSACSDKSGILTMKVEEDSMGNCHIVEKADLHKLSIPKNGLEQVTTMRLDDLNLTNVSFMKVDVEGHESLVISGAMETILRCCPLLWIESESQSFITSLQEDIGYDTIRFDGAINYLMLPRPEARSSVVYF